MKGVRKMGIKVGLQVFSIRESMAADPVSAIENAAGDGYRYLEAANHRALEDAGIGVGLSAEELKKILDATGTEIISAHISPLDKEKFKEVLEYHAKIGNHNLVYPAGTFADYDDLMRQCETFNEYGKLAKEYGMRFHYHNHAHEFMTMDGRMVIDLMMKNTDPDALLLEVDTFWAMRGGVDPLELIRKYRDRITLLHQKDMSGKSGSPVNVFSRLDREVSEEHVCDFSYWKGMTDETDFAEIGTGIMDIQSIINLANEIHTVEYMILEQDSTQMESEAASIRKSMEEFRKFEGIDWN